MLLLAQKGEINKYVCCVYDIRPGWHTENSLCVQKCVLEGRGEKKKNNTIFHVQSNQGLTDFCCDIYFLSKQMQFMTFLCYF